MLNSRDENYDIVVIGGGAVGSGICLDATLRGYKVLLLEKNDFGSGASSKSSKLVHGGVRYLEKAIKEFDKSQYNLVKEALKERAIFLKNSSNISKKLKINIPCYSYFSLIKNYIGLFIYKLISYKNSLGNNTFLNKVISSYYFPNLRKKSLKACISFYDGTFLDFRMIISLLQSAFENGAIVKNYCEVKNFLYDENHNISGVKFFDKVKNKEFEIKSKVVINATGANVDNMRFLDNETEEVLTLSSGIHIVVSKDFLSSDEAILIPNTSDNRVVFVLPFLEHCLIGTTDNKTFYEENSKVKEEEIDYLLKEVNNYFDKTLTKEDILSSWSGIRPLVKSNKLKTEQINREHSIFSSKSGLVSICGGKWTTYRKMANDMMDYLIKQNKIEKKELCKTKKYKLVGNKQKKKDLEKLASFYSISKKTKKSLISLYGDNAIKILALADENKDFDLLDERFPYLKKEIEYCIKEEFIQKPIDYLARRIGLCFIDKKSSLELVNIVCDEMAKILKWDIEKKEKEKNEAKEFIQNYF